MKIIKSERPRPTHASYGEAAISITDLEAVTCSLRGDHANPSQHAAGRIQAAIAFATRAPRVYTLEVTEDELVRLARLSYRHESGSLPERRLPSQFFNDCPGTIRDRAVIG